MRKSLAEIEKLKKDWQKDPCWDIEETEGFEDHRDELLGYRKLVESNASNKETERKVRRSKTLGIPGNLKLLNYLEGLEKMVLELERKVEQ